ncbi:hypothetical protein PVK06_028289 [Gossypium arboreum]|uniref:Uncharacterized protein n=1 Tax=Gossypium arboreum TaxID=29729 RepID=A0ABR0P4F2_GOSAR|nr:hypothetical protein PVK06_028288 [Gossypium arboreum]KAK5812846.1 hypothetical protein PVK06_028289 [Gossypium arboreum]
MRKWAYVEEGMVEVEPIEAEPGTTNPDVEEKETKSPDEDAKKTESVHIETDDEGTEEVTPTLAPLDDSITVAPPTSTEAMTEQDCKINSIIDEITKSDNEEEDVPLQSLKRKMHYKYSTRKSTS